MMSIKSGLVITLIDRGHNAQALYNSLVDTVRDNVVEVGKRSVTLLVPDHVTVNEPMLNNLVLDGVFRVAQIVKDGNSVYAFYSREDFADSMNRANGQLAGDLFGKPRQ